MRGLRCARRRAARRSTLGHHLVPDGYYVEHRVTADLDGDHIEDRALAIRRRTLLFSGQRDRRLLILRGHGHGVFSLQAEGRRALLCTECGGLSIRRPAPIRVAADHHAIVVTQSTSDQDAVTTQTLRFALRGHTWRRYPPRRPARGAGLARRAADDDEPRDGRTHGDAAPDPTDPQTTHSKVVVAPIPLADVDFKRLRPRMDAG